MAFKIRNKLLLSFLGILLPFAILAAINHYNQNIIYKMVHEVHIMAEEGQKIADIQNRLNKIIMAGNDYIITGDRRYIDDFERESPDVEEGFKEIEAILSRIKESPEVKLKIEILKHARTAWQNIKEASLKIFAIQDPVGGREAARLMEEMDYKWAYPAIEGFKKWQEINKIEYMTALKASDRVWDRSLQIILIAAILVFALSSLFSLFYSRVFVRPILTIHERADAITSGDFKGRLDIKTGDEIEQLSKAMNEMSSHLDSLYNTMERIIIEKTSRINSILESANDAVICINKSDIICVWNRKAEEMFGYSIDEAIGKELHKLIVPERYRDKAAEGLKGFFKTGEGAVIGKTFEITGLRKDGAEFPIELSVSVMNIKGEWHATGIIRDITERKRAKDELERRLEELERFRKATTHREFRIKELKEENEALKRKIEEIGEKR